MRVTTKLALVPTILITGLLLAGCSPAVKAINQNGTDKTNATSPESAANGTEAAEVTQRFEDFADAAYSVDPTALENLYGSLQVETDWDNPTNQQTLINEFELLMPELKWINADGTTWSDLGISYASVATYSYYGGYEGGIDLVIPENAVTVDGDKAAIDVAMVTTELDGETVTFQELQELESNTINLTKIDGEWLFNAKDLVASV